MTTNKEFDALFKTSANCGLKQGFLEQNNMLKIYGMKIDNETTVY